MISLQELRAWIDRLDPAETMISIDEGGLMLVTDTGDYLEVGGVGRSFFVYNETDGIPASPEGFATREEAGLFIDEFRKRFAAQGYYATARGERIPPEKIVLLVVEE